MQITQTRVILSVVVFILIRIIYQYYLSINKVLSGTASPKEVEKTYQVLNLISRVRDSYLVSLFFKKRDKKQSNEIVVDFKHKFPGVSKDSTFYTAGTVLYPFKNRVPHIFVGGAKGQDDGLLVYDQKQNKMINVINKTNISSLEATYGAVSIDLDGNGYNDLIVSRDDGVYVYLNQNGDGNFKKKLIHSTKNKDYIPIGIAVSDINKDRNLDIHISTFIRPNLFIPNRFLTLSKHRSNLMFLNDGHGSFKDVTKKVKLDLPANTFTSIFVDLNNDQIVDLVSAVDASKIHIYKGLSGGGFEKVDSVDGGYGFWMGIASGDIDNDSDQDLYLSNVGTDYQKVNKFLQGDLPDNMKNQYNGLHVLLRNDGQFKFVNISKEKNTDNYGFGWGTIFTDVNLDGHLDILMSQNSFFTPKSFTNPLPGKVLIYDHQNKRYNTKNILSNKHISFTPIVTDLNDDGYQDYVWINLKGPVKVYLNDKKHIEGNYFNIVLPDGYEFVNSVITVQTESKVLTRHHIVGGLGFASGQGNFIQIGLGKDKKINNVNVKTIYGKEYNFGKQPVNSTLLMTQKLKKN